LPWILDKTRPFAERGRNLGLLLRIVDIWASLHHLGQIISETVLGNARKSNSRKEYLQCDFVHAHISGVSLWLCVSKLMQDFEDRQWTPKVGLRRDYYRDKSDKAS
jgi:hypothetical protein